MENLVGYVAVGAVSLAVGLLLTYLQPKAKVLYWSAHSFRFDLTQQNVVLWTDALTVQNVGRRAAENVELVMDGQPDFFQFSPAMPFSQETTPEGHFVLRIATLGPKEFFTLQVLSYTAVPVLLNLRSTAGKADPMPVQIQRAYPQWFGALAAVCMIIGLGFAVYWLIRATVFVSLAIGIG